MCRFVPIVDVTHCEEDHATNMLDITRRRAFMLMKIGQTDASSLGQFQHTAAGGNGHFQMQQHAARK